MSGTTIDQTKRSTCWTCGYSWITGRDGSHSCAEHLRADAMRYRWIREHGGDAIYMPGPGFSPSFLIAQREKLDAAIDEAMRAVIEETKNG